MKKSLCNLLKMMAQKFAQEETPNEIFEQIRPLTNKLGLSVLVDRTKTAIVPGQTQGKNSLYSLTVRRKNPITSDTIERIKRNIAYFNIIQWAQEGIEIQLWWPYEPKIKKTVVPKIPSAVPAAPPKA